MTRILLSFIVGYCVLVAWQAPSADAATPPARTQAEKKALAKKLFEEAEKNYYLGRFKRALELYSKAYEVLPLPGFLFNIGQCHRMMGNYERAIFFYRGYLRAKDAKNREVVEQLIRECEKKAKERAEARRAEQQVPQRPARPARPQTRATGAPKRQSKGAEAQEARPVPPEATQPSQPKARPFYKTWWFWTAVGVGVAVLAAGIAGGVVAAGGSQPSLPSGSLGTLDRRGLR